MRRMGAARIGSLCLSFGVLVTWPALGATEQPKHVALDIEPGPLPESAAGVLESTLTEALAAHGGYELVPNVDFQRSLGAQKKKQPVDCAHEPACLLKAARKLRADLVLGASVSKIAGGDWLHLARTDTATGGTSQVVREVPDAGALPEAVRSGLADLLGWPAPAPPPRAEAPVVAAPARRTEPPAPSQGVKVAQLKLALLSVHRGEGVSAGQSSTIEEVLLNALDATGRFKVVGSSDIAALLSFEVKRQAIGCDDSECMTQIAGALGVDFVATADIGRLGTTTVVTLKIMNVRTAAVAARAQQDVLSDDGLVPAARAIANQVVAVMFGGSLRPAWARPAGWIALAAGGAALVTATILGATVRSDTSSLETTPRAGSQVHPLVQSIGTRAVGANVLFGIGGLLAAGGATVVVAF